MPPKEKKPAPAPVKKSGMDNLANSNQADEDQAAKSFVIVFAIKAAVVI